MNAFTYPPVYLKACSHLVAFGGHGGDTAHGRSLIAKALRALRAIDRDRAQSERRHMLFISGQFPVKAKARLLPRFEVQTRTVCDGWINTVSSDGSLVTFPSRFSAQNDIDSFFNDLPAHMRDNYSRDDYRVAKVTS